MSMAVYKHFPQYWKYFGIKSWTYNGKTYTNGNRLLGTFPGCDGMKTGFTNKSKYSLVATASRDNHHLMAVVLGAENKDIRAAAATNLLNRGFTMVGAGNATSAPAAPVKSVASQTQPVTKSAPAPKYSAGTAGVQFGAYSSRSAAASQVANIKAQLGVVTTIEETGTGMYRVRVAGLSDVSAQNLKSRASAAGIDCFVFH